MHDTGFKKSEAIQVQQLTTLNYLCHEPHMSTLDDVCKPWTQ